MDGVMKREPRTGKNPWHGQVSLDPGEPAEDQFEVYGYACHQAARVLRARTFRGAAYASYDGFPILILYRHALELYLKGVVLAGAKYLGVLGRPNLDTRYVYKSHDLHRLAADVVVIFKRVGWPIRFHGRGPRSSRALATLVGRLTAIEGKSEGFRYPVDTSGRRAFQEGSGVQVLGLTRQLDPALIGLDSAITKLESKFNGAAAARRERALNM